MPPTFRRRDFFLIGAVVILAVLLAFLVPKADGNRAVVRINGTVVHILPLDQNTSLAVTNNGISLTLAVQNGAVQVTHSDCPDEICQSTPAIKTKGQTIVCLPAACSITVEGDLPFDGVTY